jgi:hypothetical protein
MILKWYQVGLDRPRTQGDWYGVFRGEYLPVGHHFCLSADKQHYIDNGQRHTLPLSQIAPSEEYLSWIKLLRNAKSMIVEWSEMLPEWNEYGCRKVQCLGYIGVFYVNAIDYDENRTRILRCELGQQRA